LWPDGGEWNKWFRLCWTQPDRSSHVGTKSKSAMGCHISIPFVLLGIHCQNVMRETKSPLSLMECCSTWAVHFARFFLRATSPQIIRCIAWTRNWVSQRVIDSVRWGTELHRGEWMRTDSITGKQNYFDQTLNLWGW
jgi:hypothetical protein